MLTIIRQTLREAMNRRMGIVLLVVAAVTCGIYLYNIRFEPSPLGDGERWVRQGPNLVQPGGFVMFNYPSQLNFSGIWFLVLGVVAAAPLLTSFQEKGWSDLLLTKAVPRWQMLLGRYLGGVTLYAVALVFFHVIPALHVWRGAGYPPWQFLKAVALILLSFAGLLALMTLITVLQPNPHPGYAIIAAFAQIALSRQLADMADLRTTYTSFETIEPLFQAVHFLLPRNTELLWIGIDLVHSIPVKSWAPLWATLAFVAIAMGLSCWIFQRRSL
jgi:ABC-type transport system involved in multi-copper enzyme maturation permease subunit